MENKNIIIILLVIIVVLAAAIGFVLLNPANAKEPTRLIITSDDEQNEGGDLSIKLTDLNKTPVSNEIVNIRITDGNGNVVVDDVVKTNSKGKASLDLDLDGGEYIVNVSYGGNDNFTASNATQKLTIKEETKESSTENSVDMSLYSSYSPTIGSYRIVERQQELGLLETPDGNYYVMAGDGIYTYEGRDSQGNIQFGSLV